MHDVSDRHASVRARLLLHPLFLGALAVLLANDWWWKTAYGTWLTGKLSDVAGLVVAPVLFVALLPAAWLRDPDRRRRLNVAAHAVVAGGFVLVKLVDLDGMLAAWMDAQGLPAWPRPVIVQDATDLVALAACALSLHLVARSPESPLWRRDGPSPAWPSAGVGAVAVVATCAVVATSVPAPVRYASSVGAAFGPVTAAQRDSLVARLDRQDVAARWDTLEAGQPQLAFLFPLTDAMRRAAFRPTEQYNYAHEDAFSGAVLFRDEEGRGLVLERVQLRAWKDVPLDSAHALVRRRILVPLVETLDVER